MPMSVHLLSIVYVKFLIAVWKILPNIKRVSLVFVTGLTLLYFQMTATLKKSLQFCVKYWIITISGMIGTRLNAREKIYRRIDKMATYTRNVVTTVAYLIGIRKSILQNTYADEFENLELMLYNKT